MRTKAFPLRGRCHEVTDEVRPCGSMGECATTICVDITSSTPRKRRRFFPRAARNFTSSKIVIASRPILGRLNCRFCGSEIVRLCGQLNCPLTRAAKLSALRTAKLPLSRQLRCSRCEQSGCFFHKTHTAKTHNTHKNYFRVFAENDPFFSTFILGDRGNFSTAKMRREMPKNGKIVRFSTKPTPPTTVTANPIHKSQSFLCAFANDSKNAACGKFFPKDRT